MSMDTQRGRTEKDQGRTSERQKPSSKTARIWERDADSRHTDTQRHTETDTQTHRDGQTDGASERDRQRHRDGKT